MDNVHKRYLFSLVFFTYLFSILDFVICIRFNSNIVFVILNMINITWLSLMFISYITEVYLPPNFTSKLMNPYYNHYFMNNKKYTPSPYKLYYMSTFNPQLFSHYMNNEKIRKRFNRYYRHSHEYRELHL